MTGADPLFFSGEYDLTLDEKSRVLVPSQLRKRINPQLHGEAFYLVVSTDRKNLFMYPDRYYEWLMTHGDEPEAIPSRDQMEHDRLAFGMTQNVEPDKAGRILIPEKYRDRTGIVREVTFVGAKNRIEIWDKARWEAESNGLLDRGPQIADRARMQRRGETGLRTHTVTGMEGNL